MDTPSILAISGNPSEEEIAAITAVYISYLKELSNLPVDNSVDNLDETLNITSIRAQIRQKNVHLPGKSVNWNNIHRIKSRYT